METTITIDRNYPVPTDQVWKISAAAEMLDGMLMHLAGQEVVLDFAWKLMDNENELFVQVGIWNNDLGRVWFGDDHLSLEDHRWFFTVADHAENGNFYLGFEAAA